MRILFLNIPMGPPEKALYQHGLVALAEGLQLLQDEGMDIVFSGIHNYWRNSAKSEEFLIKNDGQVTWSNADVVVLSHEYLEEFPNFPFEIQKLNRNKTKVILMDHGDGWRAAAIHAKQFAFDLIFRSHFNENYNQPKGCLPWAFGLTNRMIQASKGSLNWTDRQQKLLYNFRVGHTLRDWVRKVPLKELIKRFPLDETQDLIPDKSDEDAYLLWSQTGRRHYPSYFHRLSHSRVSAAFGGYFTPGVSRNLDSKLLRGIFKIWPKRMTKILSQFDSWRFWESLAAGSLTLHVDLSFYGCIFPDQPKVREHYWAISPHSWKQDIQDLLEAPDELLSSIASKGRAWALHHFSPRAQAQRFINALDSIRDK